MEPKGVEPKAKTRLNAESYKIRKRLSFDNFDNIVVLEKIKKVTFYFYFLYLKYLLLNYLLKYFIKIFWYYFLFVIKICVLIG